jgi:regulatory protein
VKKNLTPELAYPKAKHYCAYSERCHADVRDKLYSMGLIKKDVEVLLSRLIEEDCLNEERYAIQFAGGHFRQKKWGKTKIIYALRQKKVSERNIQKALKEIEETDYRQTLEKLALIKWRALKGEQWINRQAKAMAFLLRKGFEAKAVQTVLQKIRSENTE